MATINGVLGPIESAPLARTAPRVLDGLLDPLPVLLAPPLLLAVPIHGAVLQDLPEERARLKNARALRRDIEVLLLKAAPRFLQQVVRGVRGEALRPLADAAGTAVDQAGPQGRKSLVGSGSRAHRGQPDACASSRNSLGKCTIIRRPRLARRTLEIAATAKS